MPKGHKARTTYRPAAVSAGTKNSPWGKIMIRSVHIDSDMPFQCTTKGGTSKAVVGTKTLSFSVMNIQFIYSHKALFAIVCVTHALCILSHCAIYNLYAKYFLGTSQQ